ERPSLLLNPWAIRSTETGQQLPTAGSEFDRAAAQGGTAGGSDAEHKPPQAPSGFSNLDFLPTTSLVLANVEPDKNGLIEIKRQGLGPHQQLVIVAVDPDNTASRIIGLPEEEEKYLDLRLAKGLDPQQHFTQQRRISIVP